MEKRIEVAAVQIVAHQQALLQQPDPAIANKTLLRVPEDLSGCDYSVQDFETCWSLGATEFEDRVWLSRGHALSKDDMRKIGEYIFVNRLEPQSVDSWILGHDRLVAAGVIKPEAPKTQTPVKHEPQAPKLIDIEKINSSTPEGRRQLREAHWNKILA